MYIDQVGRFLKLVIIGNHPNKLNTGNQVGIIAINLLGIEEPSLAYHSSSGEMASPSHNMSRDFASDLHLDPMTSNKLRILAQVKAQAVAEEDYITAKAIKNIEVELKTLGARLAEIDQEKKEAVREEDYDRAAMLKEEAMDLRNEIETKVSKRVVVVFL